MVRNIILIIAILGLSTACKAEPWCGQPSGDMSRLTGAGEYKIHEISSAYFDDYIAQLKHTNNVQVSAAMAAVISGIDQSHPTASKFYVARFGVRVSYEGKFRGMQSIKLFKEKDGIGNLYLNAVSIGFGKFIKNVPLLIEAPRKIGRVYTFCGSAN